jgi:hypothetical protein
MISCVSHNLSLKGFFLHIAEEMIADSWLGCIDINISRLFSISSSYTQIR